MLETRLVLVILWIATMLTYLLGDVLRLFSGDAEIGHIEGKVATQGMWLLISVIMVVPILMSVATAIVAYPQVRLLNLIVVSLVFVFNLIGLPYKGHYDNFLIVVSLILKGIIFYYSWHW